MFPKFKYWVMQGESQKKCFKNLDFFLCINIFVSPCRSVSKIWQSSANKKKLEKELSYVDLYY